MRGKGTVPDDGQVEAPLQTERRRENRHKRKGTKSQKHNRNQSYTIYNKIKDKNPQEKKTKNKNTIQQRLCCRTVTNRHQDPPVTTTTTPISCHSEAGTKLLHY